jgi:hypothetical protein
MNAPQPSPASLQPPPDVPNDPKISEALTQFLRTFSLWCRRGFATKLPADTALPGILLQAFDAAPGTTPAVWMLRVQSNGSFVAHQVSVGGPNPTSTT